MDQEEIFLATLTHDVMPIQEFMEQSGNTIAGAEIIEAKRTVLIHCKGFSKVFLLDHCKTYNADGLKKILDTFIDS